MLIRRDFHACYVPLILHEPEKEVRIARDMGMAENFPIRMRHTQNTSKR